MILYVHLLETYMALKYIYNARQLCFNYVSLHIFFYTIKEPTSDF